MWKQDIIQRTITPWRRTILQNANVRPIQMLPIKLQQIGSWDLAIKQQNSYKMSYYNWKGNNSHTKSDATNKFSSYIGSSVSKILNGNEVS